MYTQWRNDDDDDAKKWWERKTSMKLCVEIKIYNYLFIETGHNIEFIDLAN